MKRIVRVLEIINTVRVVKALKGADGVKGAYEEMCSIRDEIRERGHFECDAIQGIVFEHLAKNGDVRIMSLPVYEPAPEMDGLAARLAEAERWFDGLGPKEQEYVRLLTTIPRC